MNKALLFVGLGLTAGLLLSTSSPRPTLGQDPDARPGPEHKFLAEFVGEFETHTSFWLSPESKPLMLEGNVTQEMILDGRFLLSHSHVDTPGLESESYSVMGYDRGRRVYTMISINTDGTKINYFEGKRKGKGSIVLKDPFGIVQVTVTPMKKGRSNTEIVVLAAEEPYVLLSADSVRVQPEEEQEDDNR
jgi:hypothetical protein